MRMPSFARVPRLSQKLATLVQVVWYGLFLSMAVGNWPQMVFAQESCTIMHITNPSGTSTDSPSISTDSTHIASVYNSNLTGGNPDGSLEHFLFDITTNTFTPITNTTEGAAFAPATNFP